MRDKVGCNRIESHSSDGYFTTTDTFFPPKIRHPNSQIHHFFQFLMTQADLLQHED